MEPAPPGDPAPARLLLVDSDAKRLRSLTKTLRTVADDVDERSSFGEASTLDESYQLVVANYDGLAADERRAIIDHFGGRRSQTRLLLLSGGQCASDYIELFSSHTLTNLIAVNGGEVEPADLLVTVRKLLADDIFGIEKYFNWGVVPVERRVCSSTERPAVIADLEAYIGHVGVGGRFVAKLAGVAEEFLTNGLYNAPVDEQGTHLYLNRPRQQELTLPEKQGVLMRWCTDGRRLGVSATDPFGSLRSEVVCQYLARCMRGGEDQIEDKAGGAGLGFYQIFESLSHFVINIEPGVRTEMIGIIDSEGGFRAFSGRPKSFNVFFRGEPA